MADMHGCVRTSKMKGSLCYITEGKEMFLARAQCVLCHGIPGWNRSLANYPLCFYSMQDNVFKSVPLLCGHYSSSPPWVLMGDWITFKEFVNPPSTLSMFCPLHGFLCFCMLRRPAYRRRPAYKSGPTEGWRRLNCLWMHLKISY